MTERALVPASDPVDLLPADKDRPHRRRAPLRRQGPSRQHGPWLPLGLEGMVHLVRPARIRSPPRPTDRGISLPDRPRPLWHQSRDHEPPSPTTTPSLSVPSPATTDSEPKSQVPSSTRWSKKPCNERDSSQPPVVTTSPLRLRPRIVRSHAGQHTRSGPVSLPTHTSAALPAGQSPTRPVTAPWPQSARTFASKKHSKTTLPPN